MPESSEKEPQDESIFELSPGDIEEDGTEKDAESGETGEDDDASGDGSSDDGKKEPKDGGGDKEKSSEKDSEKEKGGKQKSFSQKQLDTIIQKRLAAESAKRDVAQHRHDADLAERDAKVEEMQAAFDDQAKKYEKLLGVIKENGLEDDVDGDLKASPKKPDKPNGQESSLVALGKIDQSQFSIDQLELRQKLSKEIDDEGVIALLDAKITQAAQKGEIPINIISSANKMDNGVAMLQQIVTDDGLRAQVTLAMLKAENDPDKFEKSLQGIFKGDTIEKEGKKVAGKKKPKPSSLLKGKPAGKTDDGETEEAVYEF